MPKGNGMTIDRDVFLYLVGTPQAEMAALDTIMQRSGVDLPTAQERLGFEYRKLTMVRSIYGWYIRSATGLDGRAIIFTPYQNTEDKGFSEALAYLREWYTSDPDHRSAYVHIRDLEQNVGELPDEVFDELSAIHKTNEEEE
mgnify:FL=1